MGAPIILLDTRVDMQKTLGAAKTITAITNADPGVVSATTHGFTDGDYVILAVAGMTKLDKRVVRVAAQTAGTFELEGIDTTDMGTFVSGTATEITAFDSFAQLTSWSMPEPQPNKKDYTTIHDTISKELFGLDSPITASANMLADPLHPTIINLQTASKNKETRAFVLTLQDETILMFNAFVAGGRGLDGTAPGEIMTAQLNVTLTADEQYLLAL